MQKPIKRVIDTNEYVSALKALVEEGNEVSMTIVGDSMSPFLIHNRDRIFFSAPKSPLRRGDMVFYQRANGQYVMHRICRVKGGKYYLLGDAQTVIEGPLSREQIFARINRIERKGRIIAEDDFWWRFFAGPWITLRRFRPILRRMYRLLFH